MPQTGIYRPLFCALLLLPGGMLAASARAQDGMLTYLDRWHRLDARDFTGHVELAEHCRRYKLHQQECDLLIEAYKLRPDQQSVYKDLIVADLNRFRPVDRAWAQKIEALINPRFRLYHSAHFSVLTDMTEDHARLLLNELESSYRGVYTHCAAVGLRPLPPQGRLLTVLFSRYDDYRDYLQRYENADNAWSAGHYSWRTNRSAFFHDSDAPGARDARQALSVAEQRVAGLRAELQSDNTPTARRFQVREQLKRLNTTVKDASTRMSQAAESSTLEKTRHEAAHQVLFNSGIQQRGQYYPFWLAEGLATLFEGSPRLTNPSYSEQYREVSAARRLMPLRELLSYQPRPADANNAVLDAYAQAWALTHFLWNQRPRELAVFLSRIDTLEARGNLAIHFMKCFGNLDDLEAAFRRYMDAPLAPDSATASTD